MASRDLGADRALRMKRILLAERGEDTSAIPPLFLPTHPVPSLSFSRTLLKHLNKRTSFFFNNYQISATETL